MLLLQYKQTPLHLSCLYGHSDIVKVLLSHGADIHVKDEVSKYYDWFIFAKQSSIIFQMIIYDMIIIQRHSDVSK